MLLLRHAHTASPSATCKLVPSFKVPLANLLQKLVRYSVFGVGRCRDLCVSRGSGTCDGQEYLDDGSFYLGNGSTAHKPAAARAIRGSRCECPWHSKFIQPLPGSATCLTMFEPVGANAIFTWPLHSLLSARQQMWHCHSMHSHP